MKTLSNYFLRTVFVGTLCLSAAPLFAQGPSFRKIADSTTPIPGGTGNFDLFPTADDPIAPSIDGSDVAFIGSGSGGQVGIYTEIGGVLSLVADLNTPIPGGTGNFTGLHSVRTRSRAPSGPSMGGGNVAFIGTGSLGQIGVYTNIGGPLRVVADTNTLIPGGSATFTDFDFVSTDSGNVAFLGMSGASVARGAVVSSDSAAGGSTGVYAEIGGTLLVIADTNTVAPGSTDPFIFLEGSSISGGDVAFMGLSSGRLGIFARVGGVLGVVADTNMPIPGASGNFAGFGISPSISGGAVVFRALNSDVKLGFYTNSGGAVRVVADRNTVLPGGHGLLNGIFFTAPGSINGGNIVLTAIGDNSFTLGLFAEFNGSLILIIDANATLDGKPLASMNPTTPQGEAISDTLIAFQAGFDDGSQGIFVATITLDVCGNGILEAGEFCDNAAQNSDTQPDACRADCTNARCGDGVVDSTETCDNGANNSDTQPDACRADCTNARCGDGVVDSTETCDDGNALNNDGCSSLCLLETGDPVPTTSDWGLAILGLLLLTGAKLRLGWARPVRA